MQSLASLMSVKPADVGNLDDFNESDEEEDRKSVVAAGRRGVASPSGPPPSAPSPFQLLICHRLLSFSPSSSSLSPGLCNSSSHPHPPQSPRPPAA